jgi:glycosyltransferase involved in cell wall biosynthesis
VGSEEPIELRRGDPGEVEARFEGRVHFAARSREETEERFRAAQLLVVPSSYEGFGIVYLEAMGFGLPVVASASGATDEIVRHESTGFLVPPGDVFCLARRIESLLEDGRSYPHEPRATAFEDHPGWEDSMRESRASSSHTIRKR